MLLNINTATIEEVVTSKLPGIGSAIAERIVIHRENVGLFRVIEELQLIEGISVTKVEELRDLVVLSDDDIDEQSLPDIHLHIQGALCQNSACLGHRVTARFERSEPNTTSSPPRWVQDQASGFFNLDGIATLSLPNTTLLRGNIQFIIFAPDGSRIDVPTDANGNDQTQISTDGLEDGINIRLSFKPIESIELETSDNPNDRTPQILKGQVIDLNGQRITNRQILLFASKDDTSGSDDNNFSALGVTNTDGNGRFSVARPQGMFTDAYGQVVIGDNPKVPIHLNENGKFPATTILVIETSAEVAFENDSCCDADGIVPRLPDEDDLTAANGTFSQDLGGGRCVDFTKPDRVLEEFSYQFVVRTTDPIVEPLSHQEPELDLSSLLSSGMLGNNLFFNFNSTENTPEPSEGNNSVPNNATLINLPTVNSSATRTIIRGSENLSNSNLGREIVENELK